MVTRVEKVDLELHCQYARARWHECVRGVAAGAVHQHGNNARVQETILLGKTFIKRCFDVQFSGTNERDPPVEGVEQS